ncbi:MAG TPA: hypothetical protein VN857_12250, partial [Chthoniobacterales bacterium]|nr:hypothetical protein [Chthoniobacterales bacterium]
GRRRKGHLKVAHYEVVGRVFSKATRPAWDDRLAACTRESVREPRTEGSIVPYPGRSYPLTPFPPLRSGLLSNVPTGLILSPRRGGAT